MVVALAHGALQGGVGGKVERFVAMHAVFHISVVGRFIGLRLGNHETAEGKRRCADWGGMCAALAGKGGNALPVNTEEETRTALAEIKPCMTV